MLQLSTNEIEGDTSVSNEVDENLLRSMSEDDILFHHIARDDHELYMLDCCFSELFTADDV